MSEHCKNGLTSFGYICTVLLQQALATGAFVHIKTFLS